MLIKRLSWLTFHIRIPNSKYSPNPNPNPKPNPYDNAFILEITADFNFEFTTDSLCDVISGFI